MLRPFSYFFKMEAAGGVVLPAVALLAMAAANSPWAAAYARLQSPPALLVINEGLMTLFFLLIGLEIKHELTAGSLSSPAQALFPAVAALGGVVVPACIYLLFNSSGNGSGAAMRGWAVPSATDIAFSLGALALLGRRMPPPLRIFLMAVAIFDDLAAILIIAVFYAGAPYLPGLGAGALCLLALEACRRRGAPPFLCLCLGGALWASLWQAGIHPAIGGFFLGLLLPAPLARALPQLLHPFVNFAIVPLFVFANAGISLPAITGETLAHPVTLGIGLGLFLGKPLGIMGAAFALTRCGIVSPPPQVTWGQLFAVSLLAGIGFTMSIFIATLAFGDNELMILAKTGIMIGSVASALAGVAALALSTASQRSGL